MTEKIKIVIAELLKPVIDFFQFVLFFFFFWKNTLIILVDGEWGDWSSYGACSSSCVGGQQTRTRQCNNPAPSGGGETCPGLSTESESCNSDVPCKGRRITFRLISFWLSLS